jgi:hypothetical protein
MLRGRGVVSLQFWKVLNRVIQLSLLLSVAIILIPNFVRGSATLPMAVPHKAIAHPTTLATLPTTSVDGSPRLLPLHPLNVHLAAALTA